MPLPDVLLLAAAVYGLNVSGAAAQYLYCTGIDAHGHLTFSSVQPGQVGPGGSSTLTANSAGTLWTLTETGGSAGPWTNATLFGQYNDGGSPPTSCAVTIAAPRVDASGNTYAVDNNDNPLGTADGQTSILAAISAVPAAVWTVLTATLTAANTVGKWVTGLFTAAGYTAPPSAGTIAAAILETPANKLATDAGGNVAANNLPGDYLSSGEQSELAAAAAVAPSAATIAAAILATPADKLATDTSGNVELVAAEQSELATAAAASRRLGQHHRRSRGRRTAQRLPEQHRAGGAGRGGRRRAPQRRDHRRRRGGGRAHAQRRSRTPAPSAAPFGRRREKCADGQHRRYQRQRGGSGRGAAIDLVAYQNCAWDHSPSRRPPRRRATSSPPWPPAGRRRGRLVDAGQFGLHGERRRPDGHAQQLRDGQARNVCSANCSSRT